MRITRAPKPNILKPDGDIELSITHRLLFVFCVAVLCGCASRPTIVQSCNLRNAAARPEGLALLATFDNDKASWMVFNWSTGSAEHHPVLDVFEKIPPDDKTITISPSGKWVAYEGLVLQQGYYIKSLDGLAEKFVPPENYGIFYSEKQQKWFLQAFSPRSLSEPIYPFLPNEQEQKKQYISRDPQEEKIAINWIATSGTKEIPALIITNGVDVFSYPDWKNDWQSLDGWLDESTVILRRYAGTSLLDPEQFPSMRGDVTILFNPFTGEKIVSGDNYPNLSSLSSWPPAYSPSRRYILYAGSGEAGSSLVVFDRSKNIPISQVKIQADQTVPLQPLWISETEFLYIVQDSESDAEEWFYADLSGKEYPFSDLHHHFIKPIISSVLSPTFSPNHAFLSFWLTNSVEENIYKLLFLDLRQRKIYDFCLTANQNIFTDSVAGQAWLGENMYAFSIPEEKSTKIVIIDVDKREITEISIPVKAILVGVVGTTQGLK